MPGYVPQPPIPAARLHFRDCGGVVQLVRTPACHAGGRGFESRRSRPLFKPFDTRRRACQGWPNRGFVRSGQICSRDERDHPKQQLGARQPDPDEGGLKLMDIQSIVIEGRACPTAAAHPSVTVCFMPRPWRSSRTRRDHPPAGNARPARVAPAKTGAPCARVNVRCLRTVGEVVQAARAGLRGARCTSRGVRRLTGQLEEEPAVLRRALA